MVELTSTRVVQLAIGLEAEWRLAAARPIKIFDFSRSPIAEASSKIIAGSGPPHSTLTTSLFMGNVLVRKFERSVKNPLGALILLDFRTIPKNRRWIIAQVCAATK
jgi:hypothetical protein